MSDQRSSDSDQTKRDIPSFIEPRPPLVLNPFMRPKPQKGTNLLELFDEDSENEEPEWLQVYLRLKPCNVRNHLYEVKSDRCLITSVDTATMGHGRRTQHNISKMYTFSHIFGPESNQKEIFEQVVKDNLKKLPDGQNFTLLTYGASGSGKTYTLMGTVQAPGLVPRSLEYVFRVVDAAQQPLYKPVDGGSEKLEYYDQEYEIQFVRRLRQVSVPLRDKYRRMSVQLRNDFTTSTLDLSNRTRYYVWVSFVEIYNEAIYDLLSQSDRSKATSKLRIREDSNGNVYVKGATQAFVRTGEEAYDILVAGKHNLQVAATGVHANSSRSHCIFTITMLTETEDGVRTSCVRLCDLAGCERARQTRNTGARMQESRAINSSLHVLERCLHMLRRKQKKVDATLVPYRESKLTRLLGAGLSGARGEAVSMVVTLNPAPAYAHETKHVLQLAAVAKDIQVNHTIPESSLEVSSIPDTTVEPSAELMRLRADVERLHFELVQAQSRNKELMAAMEQKQQETAKTMFEIVEEAKDMTKQYYEAQIHSLREEMEEMQEEYESKLKVAHAHADIRRDSLYEMGTPSRSKQQKIAELMTTIALLEEKLTAEKLARVRAEEEVQHLRACIEERDEKSEEDSVQNEEEEVMSVTDSEEEEENPYNESLEPTFKKEDINRSRLVQSLMNDSKLTYTNDDSENDSIKNDNFQDVRSQDDTMKDSTYTTDESNTTNVTRKKDSTFITDESHKVGSAYDIDSNRAEVCETYYNIDKSVVKPTNKVSAASSRGTYVVSEELVPSSLNEVNNDAISQKITKVSNAIVKIPKSIVEMEQDIEKSTEQEQTINRMSEKITNVVMKKLLSNKPNCQYQRNASLAQFEQLEIASKIDEAKLISTEDITKDFSNINILKKKRNYFDEDLQNDALPKSQNDIPQSDKDKNYFENINVNIDYNKHLNQIKQLMNDERSPSIVKEDVTSNFEPSTIKKLLGESFTRQPDILPSVSSLPKKHASVDIFESPNVMITKDIQKSTEKITTLQNSEKDTNKTFDKEKTKEISIQNVNTDAIEKNDSIFAKTIGKTDSKMILNKEKIREIDTQNINTLNVEKNDSIFANHISDNYSEVKLNKDKAIKEVNTQNMKIFGSEKNDSVSAKHGENDSIVKLDKSEFKQKDNLSIFENCIEKASMCIKVENIESARNSMEDMVLKYEDDSEKRIIDNEIKMKKLSIEQQKEDIQIPDKNEITDIMSCNNTVEDFDKIFKNVTDSRATEFEMLLSQITSNNNATISNIDSSNEFEKPKYNLRHKFNTSAERKGAENNVGNKKNTESKKDIAEHRDRSIDKKSKGEKDTILDKRATTEVLLETQSKCESKTKPKRNLRLRKRKNDEENDQEKENDPKFNNMVNLQKEFSDVTMDVPAPIKEVKDIESPEKEEESVAPLLGIQSCPSKSITRSRRKLFTPRAEPLEESMAASEDSNERVRVPRPSYHRTRARRKL